MRLSELVSRYGSHDPIVLVENEDGVPVPPCVDFGVMAAAYRGMAIILSVSLPDDEDDE